MWPFGKKSGGEAVVKTWRAPSRGAGRDVRGNGGAAVAGSAPAGGAVRRWDAVNLNRLTSAHWAGATGSSINTDLAAWQKTLWAHCAFEASNNGFVDGMIRTHVEDVVGPNGPRLQVLTADKEYATELESAWEVWWARPDVAGRLSGVELLKLWVRGWWSFGEHLVQLVSQEIGVRSQKSGVRSQNGGIGGEEETTGGTGRAGSADTGKSKGNEVTLRLNTISPRRLGNPSVYADDVVLGVKRDAYGKPIEYAVEEWKGGAEDSGQSLAFVTLPADVVIHDFEQLEPGQARGVPLLASVLQVIADLRDYLNQVMDAARQAADFSVLLYSDSPDIAGMMVEETTDVERRTMSTLPPGWKATQIDPKQPSTTYKEYVLSRLQEIGRPVCMPLMIVTLDSSGHNYSSARFDDGGYRRTIGGHRGRLARNTLDVVFVEFKEEFDLRRGGRAPVDVRTVWIWPPSPHVDPVKEATAAKIRVENCMSTLRDECAAVGGGGDWEEVIDQRGREVKKMEEAGVVVSGGEKTTTGSTGPDGEEDGEDSTAKNPKKSKSEEGESDE